MNRLIKTTPPANTQLSEEYYHYDVLGNRISDSNSTGDWTYQTNNRLSSSPAAEYLYDENGDITQQITAGKQINYLYDAERRLVQVEITGSENKTIKYDYDAENRRIKKEIDGEITWYLYHSQGLAAELDANGNIKVVYGWVDGNPWGTNPLFQKRNNQLYWYQNDHLGTPKLMIDTAGNIVWESQSESFGKTNMITATIENNLRFPGQYYDQETGLHYNYHRYYDPSIGRYLQKDPIGLGGGLNMYAYADGNPIMGFDSLGLRLEVEPDLRRAYDRIMTSLTGMKVFSLLAARIWFYHAKKEYD